MSRSSPPDKCVSIATSIILVSCLLIWRCSFNTPTTHQTIPFGPVKISEIVPQPLVKSITDALNIHDKILYVDDSFLAVVANKPSDSLRDTILTHLHFSFFVLDEEVSNRYEVTYDPTQNILNLYNCHTEAYSSVDDSNAISLESALSALIYFPTSQYQESTQYGHEPVDFYRFSIQSSDAQGEIFSYDTAGHITTFSYQNYVNLNLAHCCWDDSREISFGGPVRANLHFVLE